MLYLKTKYVIYTFYILTILHYTTQIKVVSSKEPYTRLLTRVHKPHIHICIVPFSDQNGSKTVALFETAHTDSWPFISRILRRSKVEGKKGKVVFLLPLLSIALRAWSYITWLLHEVGIVYFVDCWPTFDDFLHDVSTIVNDSWILRVSHRRGKNCCHRNAFACQNRSASWGMQNNLGFIYYVWKL